MSITQAIPDSFHLELSQGVHDFRTTGDTYKMALYLGTATLGTSSTVYTSTGEVSGTGYTAGGSTLTNVDPVQLGGKGLYDFANLTFSTLTVTGIYGALIYNSTNGNRAVCALNFGATYSPVAQNLVITFPSVTATTAILRIK